MSVGPLCPMWGDVCEQFRGCMSVEVYIIIAYIMPTIGGICVGCWVQLKGSDDFIISF